MDISSESLQKAKSVFTENGISISEWARTKGFSASLVYQVLEGRRPCLRGQCHQIAVALGLKKGSVKSVDQLDQHLSSANK